MQSLFKIGMCVLAAMCVSCFAIETQSIGNPVGTNFPKDGEGRVYHLGLKKGEVANRILLVGDPDRAKLIVTMFDHPEDVFVYASNRGFTTYTGTKRGTPVTIMSIGMGLPMMDFAIREIRAITEGPLFIIRLGSCGTPHDDIPIGTLVVADKSFCITTNYAAYHQEERSDSVLDYFTLTPPIEPDLLLHQTLVTVLKENCNGTFTVVEGTDATADSFYGSQGRLDDEFDDRNEGLIDTFMNKHPNTGSLQMETFHLFHLAKLNGDISAAGCAIVLAQRKSNAFLSNERKHQIEIKAGNACLEALVR